MTHSCPLNRLKERHLPFHQHVTTFVKCLASLLIEHILSCAASGLTNYKSKTHQAFETANYQRPETVLS